MSRSASVCYAGSAMQKWEPIVSEFLVTLSTGVPTISANMIGYPVFVGNLAANFTQALIDSFLGTTSEFAVTTAFGATAMGTDQFGFVLNCQGMAASAAWVTASLTLVSGAAGVVSSTNGQGTVTTVLPNTLTSGVAVTTGGNIYGRQIVAGEAGATGTSLLVRVGWYAK